MMDHICLTGNLGLMNSEGIKQGRNDLGHMSSVEVLKSNKSYRGYSKKGWESKKKQAIFYGFPPIAQ